MTASRQPHISETIWRGLAEQAHYAVRCSYGCCDRVYGYLPECLQYSGRMLGPPAIDLSTVWVRVDTNEATDQKVAASARRLCAAKEVGYRIVPVNYDSQHDVQAQPWPTGQTMATNERVNVLPLKQATPIACGLVVPRNSRDIGVALSYDVFAPAGPEPTILPVSYKWLDNNPHIFGDVARVVRFVGSGVAAQTRHTDAEEL